MNTLNWWVRNFFGSLLGEPASVSTELAGTWQNEAGNVNFTWHGGIGETGALTRDGKVPTSTGSSAGVYGSALLNRLVSSLSSSLAMGSRGMCDKTIEADSESTESRRPSADEETPDEIDAPSAVPPIGEAELDELDDDDYVIVQMSDELDDVQAEQDNAEYIFVENTFSPSRWSEP
jgi:hypothetical protein